MDKFRSEKSKIQFDKINEKMSVLQNYELEHNEEMPMSMQMKAYLYDFSFEDKSITIAFPVQKKQLNPNKAMIGGLITYATDMACGLLIFALHDGSVIPPTITLTTNFINPIFADDTLLITSKIQSWGKRIINITATGTSKDTGKTIITATTAFVSTDAFSLK